MPAWLLDLLLIAVAVMAGLWLSILSVFLFLALWSCDYDDDPYDL